MKVWFRGGVITKKWGGLCVGVMILFGNKSTGAADHCDVPQLLHTLAGQEFSTVIFNF